MKLITINNIFFTKYILAEKVELSEVEAKLNRFQIISMDVVDATTVKYNTFRSGWTTVTISEAFEVSYQKTQMTLLFLLSKLHAVNEHRFSGQSPEFVNKYRQKYFAIVEKMFLNGAIFIQCPRACKYLVKMLNKFDGQYRWFHKDGKIYQVAY